MTTQILSGSNTINRDRINSVFTGKSITDTVVNGFFTVDSKWNVIFWNKAAEKLLGINAADITGRNLWEELVEFIPLEFYKVYYKAFQQNGPFHFEEYWAEKGGWFDVITYQSNNTLSVSFKSLNQSVDPQFTKDPAQRMKIISELYQFVTEVTNDCLWEWNFKTREMFWIDGGHKRILGYPIENALISTRFWESCLHPEDKERIVHSIQQITSLAGTLKWEEEYRFKKANGDYVYLHDRGHIIYESGRPLRMIGAGQDITSRKLTEAKLVHEIRSKQNEMTEAVLTAQENERTMIGRELHDNLNQILGAAKLYIEMARTDQTHRELFLDKSSGYILKVIEEIRRISKNLLPPVMHFMDLFESVKILIEDLIPIHAIQIEFNSDDINVDDISEKLQLNLFRIVQEQVTNILKHSNATHAMIDLSKHNETMVLSISDNGKGFDMLERTDGVGIRNIISRAELFQGTATISSQPQKGYKIKVVLPLKDN